MPRYLTCQQYRASDEGLDLTGITDLSLARYISRAESAIDAFVGFALQDGGFEPHVVWRQAQFDERTLRMKAPNFPVPMRQVLRYRIQVSNLSGTGAGFFANIADADVSLNVTEGYVEIVPLQSITYSLAPVLIQLGLRPPIVQSDIEVGYYIAAFKDALLPTPGWAQTGVFVATRGFWAQTYTQSLASQPNTLPPIPPVIYVNGSVVTTGFTVNYTEGQITFNPPLTGNPTVQADYTYTIPDDVMGACIDQVTYQLGRRRINQMGMTGIGMTRNNDIEIRTLEAFPARFPTDTGALCEQAAKRLLNYVEIPVA